MARKKKKNISRTDQSVSKTSAAEGERAQTVENSSSGIDPNLAMGLVGVGAIALVFLSPLVGEGTAEQFLNWIPFLLWIILAAGTCGIVAFGKCRRPSFNKIDLCVYAVCGWAALSGLVTLYAESGHARPTINSTWQWLGYAITYFVIRNQAPKKTFRKAAIYALVAISIGCSVSALYQRYIVYPEVWNSYNKLAEPQKQETLRQGGLGNVEPGSRERVMWENRLYATSPTSTFVLTNSLAAFLTPWLVVIAAMVFSFSASRNWKWLAILLLGGLLLVVALLMTKSRTSYLAAAIGVLVVNVGCSLVREIRIPVKKLALVFFVGILILGGIAFVTGIVDLEVVSESFKSLSFRMEYWRASFSMIQENWIFGCGPGNFQHSYARVQLVEASETVSDPHNFVIEIWAIAGTPAIIFLTLGSIFWIQRIQTFMRLSKAELNSDSVGMESVDSFQEQMILPVAAIIGTVIAIFISILNEMNLGLCAISGLVAIVLSLSMIQLKRVPEEVVALTVGLMAFAIGLSASGGIGFPSVATTGILLLALTSGLPIVNSDEETSKTKRSEEVADSDWFMGPSISRAIYIGLLVVLLVSAFGFRWSVIDPIRKAKELANVAELEAANGRLDNAIQRMDLAIAADPYDGNYQFFKLQLHYSVFQRVPSVARLNQMEAVARKSVTVRPNNSKVALESAKMFLSLLLRGKELDENMKGQLRKLTIEFLEIATGRRPNDALHAAYRAFGHSATGDVQRAKEWAETALNLDEQNPHSDKDLKNLPFRIQGYQSDLDIEQELVKIRNQ